MKKGIHMIENLLSQMTLEEKIAQLGAVHAYQLVENGSFSTKKAMELARLPVWLGIQIPNPNKQ